LITKTTTDVAPRRQRRILLTVIAIPILVVLVMAATKAFRIYANNRAADSETFPTVGLPEPGQSIVIVSPHPDDETLGTAGLIQYALANGVPVHVIFLTDGDAFKVGVARYYHEIRVQPDDYVRYGEMREAEARASLGSLGLPASDITFLGFPDQGLLPIFRSHWYESDPYQSHFDRRSAVPYSDAYHPGDMFAGETVVADLAKLFTEYRPTDIYTTHPSDDHPDHAAAPAFIDATIAQLQANGESWAGNAKIHYFIIHRGDWPVPQGLHPDEILAPPSPMISLDTRWSTLPLTSALTNRKKSALTHYGSQQEMMGRFLVSFIRRGELFGDLEDHNPVLPQVQGSQIKIDGDGSEWPVEAPLDLDPNGDSVIRDFQPGADLTAVYACADPTTLYVRIDSKGPMSPDIHYAIYVRAFDSHSQTSDNCFFVSMCPRNMNPGINYRLVTGAHCAYKGSTMEIAIPRSILGIAPAKAVTIEANTMFAHVIVDKTGIRRALLQ
jgi:LmbE family N-acetylglucosaminyl deacetylase